MKFLKDQDVIFVHYPVGSGGWFLSSLIYYAHDQTETFEFDLRGSGHGNRAIQYINNFYKDFVNSKEGKDILHESNYENFSKQQRLEYLRKMLLVSPLAKDHIPHVISIHCQNINIFLEAFPNSKCVQINITEEQLSVCRFNYLFKIIATTDFHCETFCKDSGLTEIETHQAKSKIQDLRSNFKDFDWATPIIKKLNKTLPNELIFDKRIFEIFYTEYMNDPADHLVTEICNFLQINVTHNLHNELAGYIFQYRALQPQI